MGADVLERPPLVRAEVQLSNVRIDFDRQIQDIGNRLRGFPGAQQWARDDDIRSRERSDVRRNRRGLLVAELIEWDVSPPDEYAADVALRPSVAHEYELAATTGWVTKRDFYWQIHRGSECATFRLRHLNLHNHRQYHRPAPRLLEQEVRRGIP